MYTLLRLPLHVRARRRRAQRHRKANAKGGRGLVRNLRIPHLPGALGLGGAVGGAKEGMSAVRPAHHRIATQTHMTPNCTASTHQRRERESRERIASGSLNLPPVCGHIPVHSAQNPQAYYSHCTMRSTKLCRRTANKFVEKCGARLRLRLAYVVRKSREPESPNAHASQAGPVRAPDVRMRLPHRLLTCCWLQPPEGTMHLNGMGIARGGDTSPRATAPSTLLTHL